MTSSVRRITGAALSLTLVLSLATATAREPRPTNRDSDSAASFTAAIHKSKHTKDYQSLLLSGQGVNPSLGVTLGNSNGQKNHRSSGRRRLASANNMSVAGPSLAPAPRSTPRRNLRILTAGGRSVPAALAKRSSTTQQRDRVSLVTGKNKTVRMLRGKLGGDSNRGTGSRAVDFPAIGKSFIADNRPLFGLQDPEQELRLKRDWMDSTGRSHAVYQRLIRGVPILHEEIAVHGIGPDLYFVNGRYNNLTIAGNSSVNLTPDEAWAQAVQHLSVSPSAVLQKRYPDLQMLESEGAYHYVYEVKLLLNNMIRWKLVVDAGSGKILDARKDIRTQLVNASGTDALGNRRNFTAWQEGESYYLVDPSTPTPDASYDPVNIINNSGDQFLANAANADNFETLVYSTSSSSNAGWDPVGVSVFANTRQTYDYYLNTHGRNSIDDKGMNLISIIHYDQDLANAFWNGIYMVFGDGDGSTFSELGACLDVVAHELTHGVVETTAGLAYRNQSGALNESFTDIMGVMVDREDWLVGEDCVIRSPGYLRSLSAPNSGLGFQPGHMSEYQYLPDTAAGDWGGVHINSGIPNRAAYLAAEGLSAEGTGASIGRSKTEQIFYRGFTTYLTSASEFVDARFATIQAAEDLYGSNSQEYRSIIDAWDAVGVTGEDGSSPGTGTPIESTVGDDFIVYLYPVDGSNDGSDPEYLDLYRQAIPDPFPGYDPALDLGPLNIAQYTNGTAAAPITVQDELFVLYVGLDANIYIVNPDGSEEMYLDDGETFSLAVSPDYRYIAVTPLDVYDNNIYVYDFDAESWSNYPIESPNYADTGSIPSTALYAESLAFDYTGRKIIYDYVTCVPSPGEDCDPLTAFGYWSIGTLDVTTGRFAFPFPAQSPDIDLGFPRFPNKTNRYFVFDFNDWSEFDNTGVVDSSILVFDTIDQDFEVVGVPTFEDLDTASWGVPSFSGNDDYTVFQSRDSFGTLGVRTPLEDYAWAGEVEIWNDFDVAAPVAHRNANRSVNASLGTDKSRLDFGSVPTGQAVTRTLILTNLGNRDIDITDVSVTGEYFTHNMSNKTLPAGENIEVTVSFTSGRVGGNVAGMLTIDHNGDNFELAINLVAVVTGSDVEVEPLDTNGNGRTDWDEGILVDEELTINPTDMQLLRLYTGALGRLPDLGGFDFWRGRIATGTDFSRIGDEFYWSSEMQIQMDADGNGFVSDEEFVNHLYFNVLLRAPDEGGFNYWMGRLAAGDNVGFVMASFLNGQEYVDSTLGLLAEFALDNPDLW
ncbi:MAG: M4 family metallopeptidase [Gammaproteobacteria bacterium]|nr:M4 family metallopeptidase [Gammaproteobacteria bacterium]